MILDQDTLLFFQEMKQHFIKRGHKETIEKSFQKFLFQRSLKKKVNLYSVLRASMLNLTLSIRLKTEKRGRNVIYHVEPVEKSWSCRKALGLFAKDVKEKKTKTFILSLEKAFQLLDSNKGSLRLERDTAHSKALKLLRYKKINPFVKRKGCA
jgi:hypothetical protein